MSFLQKATERFPHAKWTGGGAIHASIYRQGEVPIPFSKPRVIMKSLMESQFCLSIMRVIVKNCPDMEWLMSPEQFEQLLLVDYHRLLKGGTTQETKFRLKNPSTGNLFHRCSLVPDSDMVGGVRVWVADIGAWSTEEGGGTQLGFRFRLESLYGESEHKKVRQKAAEQVIENEAEMSEIKEYVEAEKVQAVQIEELLFH